MGQDEDLKKRLVDTNDINRGDTTAAANLLWTIDHLLNEQLRKCSLANKVSVDNLRFYWVHKSIDSGIYDTYFGIPPNLQVLQKYMLDGRFAGTTIDRFTIIGPKENTGATASDFNKVGMLIETESGCKRYYIRESDSHNKAFSEQEQVEVVNTFKKFFTMGVSGNDGTTITEVMEHESFQTVRKALRQVFTVVWEYLPDVNYIKQRFAGGKIKTLAKVMEYVAEILGVKKEKPDINRFYGLFNSVPALVNAGISGPSLMTCLREEMNVFIKRYKTPIDLMGTKWVCYIINSMAKRM